MSSKKTSSFGKDSTEKQEINLTTLSGKEICDIIRAGAKANIASLEVDTLKIQFSPPEETQNFPLLQHTFGDESSDSTPPEVTPFDPIDELGMQNLDLMSPTEAEKFQYENAE